MDTEWRDNEFIVDYAGAIFRLQNLISIMKLTKFSFTVPFVLGMNINAGSILNVSLSHLSYDGDIDYTMQVTGVIKSKSNNSVTISGLLLPNESTTESFQDNDTDGDEWQDSDEGTEIYQDGGDYVS
jgi:hypothetical protein